MMLNGKKQRGFSLAEVLMALAILAVGMAFIAGVFPAGIYYTIISTERTLGSVVADEAFAKIRLYGVDVNSLPSKQPQSLDLNCADFLDASAKPTSPDKINPDEFAYPSDPNIDKQYYWSALCRRVSGTKPGKSMVQVTVFVSRKTGVGTNYYNPLNIKKTIGYPRPVYVTVEAGPNPTRILQIRYRDENDKIERTFINAGSIIVEDTFGRIYRVVERSSTNLDEITLERDWQGLVSDKIWVIPPPVGGGRQPCIGVFQREMLF
jgi:prepilin-type N-terminal cleavage/methylation domain-containing protein